MPRLPKTSLAPCPPMAALTTPTGDGVGGCGRAAVCAEGTEATSNSTERAQSRSEATKCNVATTRRHRDSSCQKWPFKLVRSDSTTCDRKRRSTGRPLSTEEHCERTPIALQNTTVVVPRRKLQRMSHCTKSSLSKKRGMHSEMPGAQSSSACMHWLNNCNTSTKMPSSFSQVALKHVKMDANPSPRCSPPPLRSSFPVLNSCGR
mmetsp:Transcript_135222/g.350376  ORF Transcript_135222/g.350376 Transcript_135222/m.350376 type:complete len:205 (+) Transcript_135222:491-1105(+)